MNDLDRKHFVFVLDSMNQGGAERQAYLLAEGLRNKVGARITIVSLRGDEGQAADAFDAAGLKRKYIPFFCCPGTPRYQKIIKLLKLAWTLRKLKPDLLLPYTSYPNIYCSVIWKLTGAKACVWNQRDAGICLVPPRLAKTALRKATVVVSNSEHALQFLRKEFNLALVDAQVVCNGIKTCLPACTKNSYRKQQDIPANAFVATMVANLHSHKDHMTLLAAWEKVVKEWPNESGDTPLLLLAGRHCDTAEECQAFVSEKNMNSYVRFMGAVKDVASLLAASDLCVFSSFREGVPNGILEAMALGLPVVATDIPGIREAVGEEAIEFLSPPGDALTMSNLITKFVNAPSLISEAGNKNLLRVKNVFSMNHMYEQFFGLFGNLLQK